MIIKKFQAETEEEAILQAKDSLGSNAVVVNIKTIKPRGIMGFFKKPTVEVTAALEEKDNPEQQVQEKKPEADLSDGKDIIKAIDEIRIREEQKKRQQAPPLDIPVRQRKEERNPYLRQLENSGLQKDEKDLEKKLESLQHLLEENLAKKGETVSETEENEEEEETEIEIYAKLI